MKSRTGVSPIVQGSILFLLLATAAEAQIDIRITPPSTGVQIAVFSVCNSTLLAGHSETARNISTLISTDVRISGLYSSRTPDDQHSAHVPCTPAEAGILPLELAKESELAVGGTLRSSDAQGTLLSADLFVYDLRRRQAVIAKRYQFSPRNSNHIAHQFATELLEKLSGERIDFEQTIVFVSGVNGSRELFASDLAGAERRRLTYDNAENRRPSCSLDGRVLYLSVDNDGGDVFSVPLSGGHSTQDTRLPGIEIDPDVAPDGKTFLSSIDMAGHKQLVLFNLGGRAIDRILTSEANDTNGRWSPDASRIAFASDRNGISEIFIWNTNSLKLEPLAGLQGKSCSGPAWSHSGDQLAFACMMGNGHQIFTAKSDGSAAAQLTFSGDNIEPAWAVGDSLLVFSTGATQNVPKDLAVFSLVTKTTAILAKTPEDEREPIVAPSK